MYMTFDLRYVYGVKGLIARTRRRESLEASEVRREDGGELAST